MLLRLKINFDVEVRTQIRNRKAKIWNLEDLKQEQIKQKFQMQVIAHSGTATAAKTIDGYWESLEEQLIRAADDSLGCKRWTQAMRRIMLQTKSREDIRKYQEQKRITKRVYKKAKRIYYENKLKDLEDHYSKKNIRNF
ncbi:hypothetical protein QE152_g24392 [Popillia japonica]|uniref:Uncharacterized protein n=1 Tax=Popillia japonica TaxID=7064 RepID=A0AAW1KFY5_POPJA